MSLCLQTVLMDSRHKASVHIKVISSLLCVSMIYCQALFQEYGIDAILARVCAAIVNDSRLALQCFFVALRISYRSDWLGAGR
jgi:hypothetical protein